MTVELAVKNSEEDIEFNKFLTTGTGHYKCNRCQHRWRANLGEMMENPTCRRCGK